LKHLLTKNKSNCSTLSVSRYKKLNRLKRRRALIHQVDNITDTEFDIFYPLGFVLFLYVTGNLDLD